VIERRDARGREVGHVARDDRHVVHECRRRDQPVAQGAGIGHVPSCTPLGDGGVDAQDAARECGPAAIRLGRES
jgi:hypothetical protein